MKNNKKKPIIVTSLYEGFAEEQRKRLISFVKDQFDSIKNRNLAIPITFSRL